MYISPISSNLCQPALQCNKPTKTSFKGFNVPNGSGSIPAIVTENPVYHEATSSALSNVLTGATAVAAAKVIGAAAVVGAVCLGAHELDKMYQKGDIDVDDINRMFGGSTLWV